MSMAEAFGIAAFGIGSSALGPADHELTRRVQHGDKPAVTQLYLRHHSAVVTYARRLCQDARQAENLVDQAFIRTLQLLVPGRGSGLVWRPHLYAVVWTLAADLDPPGRRPGSAIDTPTRSSGAQTMLVMAFHSLGERHQTVLWHAVIEAEPHARVAALLGTTAGNVGMMTYRARHRLREVYLAVHATTACAEYSSLLARTAHRPLARPSRRLRGHLATCIRCHTALTDLTDLNQRLRAWLLPPELLAEVLERDSADTRQAAS